MKSKSKSKSIQNWFLAVMKWYFFGFFFFLYMKEHCRGCVENKKSSIVWNVKWSYWTIFSTWIKNLNFPVHSGKELNLVLKKTVKLWLLWLGCCADKILNGSRESANKLYLFEVNKVVDSKQFQWKSKIQTQWKVWFRATLDHWKAIFIVSFNHKEKIHQNCCKILTPKKFEKFLFESIQNLVAWFHENWGSKTISIDR